MSTHISAAAICMGNQLIANSLMSFNQTEAADQSWLSCYLPASEMVHDMHASLTES